VNALHARNSTFKNAQFTSNIILSPIKIYLINKIQNESKCAMTGLIKKNIPEYQFMLGNHAIAEGAIAAGCRYFAGYPITPASEIGERISERMPEVGGRFIQMEDELGSIYSVIGASLAGAKSMTATASAGFDYMQEGIEFAVATETPLVIVDVMRLRGAEQPTQADIMQVRWGAAGDHEMIVLAPSSVQELYDYTIPRRDLQSPGNSHFRDDTQSNERAGEGPGSL